MLRPVSGDDPTSARGARMVASTADPAYATDDGCRIVGWNGAATDLLGFEAEQVLGRPCHEILAGRDVFGNRFCDESCPVSRMVRRQEPVRHFDLDVLDGSGHRRRVRFSIVVVPDADASRCTVIHLFVAAEGEPADDVSASSTVPAAGQDAGIDPAEVLTPREIEVLRLLAAGNSSQDIAHLLTVSLTTVRSHIQNILQKLEVHSQIEAVSLAFRKSLI